MKQPTLKGSVKDGIFTPENPYSYNSEVEYMRSLDYTCNYDAFERDYPYLPIFTLDNIPVKDAENVEAVGPVWQYRPKAGINLMDNTQWREYRISWEKRNGNEYRQVYILLEAPKESEEPVDTDPLSDKSDVDERAEQWVNSLGRIDDPADCPTMYESYIQGATDQEKLMQAEIVALKLENDRLYIKLNELETLLRNKQQ